MRLVTSSLLSDVEEEAQAPKKGPAPVSLQAAAKPKPISTLVAPAPADVPAKMLECDYFQPSHRESEPGKSAVSKRRSHGDTVEGIH